MSQVQLGPVTRLSPADVQALWVANGGDPAAALTAAAIVFSSENPAGNAGLVNDTPATGDYSVGLFQINYYGNLLQSRTAQFGDPATFAADPNLQVKAAIAMSSNGTNWQPWGPDFGYSDYSKPVPAPIPGSRVDRWLQKNGGGSSPLVASISAATKPILVAGGLFVLAAIVAEAISPGSTPLSPYRKALRV
jgi:Lysozyme like domain